MVELDGRNYTLKTPLENTTDAISYVNTFLTTNNIRNSKGDLIQIEEEKTSVLYLLFLAFGYLVTLHQRLLYSLGCGFNITASSDAQFLPLAEAAGLLPLPATYTTILFTVYNQSLSYVFLTAVDYRLETHLEGQEILFRPLYDISIAPGSMSLWLFQTDTLGAWLFSNGVFSEKNIDPLLPRDVTATSSASTPGKPEENIASLRIRMQQKGAAFSAIDQCATALRQLPGITTASIFFNERNETNTIGSQSVPPRTASLFIQGYSSAIAQTVYNYLFCSTYSEAGSLSQTYTTPSGYQRIVYWTAPTPVEVHIQVTIAEQPLGDIVSAIRSTLLTSLVKKVSGEGVVSGELITTLAPLGYTVKGALVRTNDNWSIQVRAQPNELLSFNAERIQVVTG